MKVGKILGPSGNPIDHIKAAEATGVKGLFRFLIPLNRKARVHRCTSRVIPYRYIKVRTNGGQT